MAMDISVRPDQLTENEDRRWLAHRKGFDTNRPIMLDLSLFDIGHTAAKGAIPSGTALAPITASPGFYGPYDPDGLDGREVFAGFLFSTLSIDSAYTLATAPDQGVALTWEGIINQDYLPTFTVPGNEGLIDAAARADMPSFRFEGTDL